MEQDPQQDVDLTPEERSQLRQAYQHLLKSPGWDQLLKFYNQQYDLRVSTIINESVTSEEIRIKHEAMRGELSGMATLLKWPELALEELEENKP